MSVDHREGTDGAVDLVRYFHALRPEARREYLELAEKDREFGEDVEAERRANDTKDTRS